jgi:hypothetical protein
MIGVVVVFKRCMNSPSIPQRLAFASVSAVLLWSGLGSACAAAPKAAPAVPPECEGDNGGLSLASGFCATVFADNIGHARHLVVAPSGVVYVNTWSGRHYGNDTPPSGGFLVALQDKSATGHADVIKRFGDGAPQGVAGGTGIAFYKNAIYPEVNDRIVRYALAAGEIAPSAKADVILSGLPLTGDEAAGRCAPPATCAMSLEQERLRK